ncbi:hypothetical protein [uncultured Ilyobacter sp.]|uniref:hypothetical protein n=1 Tax=uncultured Ilyobacter sp. TaxID=544433 RepID=UPI0029C8835D|nr:hypothetical protein [uncultured Ilyobacter sp.]
MRIGVMNCKGCRYSEYDSDIAFEKIKNYFNKDIFISEEDSDIADIWLLISKCSNPCMDHSALKSSLGKLFIMDEKDADKAIYMIEKLRKNFNVS